MFPAGVRLCVLCQIINTHNSKKEKSSSRSVRSDRNAYLEKLDWESFSYAKIYQNRAKFHSGVNIFFPICFDRAFCI